MPKTSKSAKSTKRSTHSGAGLRGRKAGLAGGPTDIAFDPPVAVTRGSLAIKTGAEPPVQTVIYIHGIGNKPEASVLKCQWDTALFGVQMGDRTRMAYWVNREYYAEPSPETCAAGDVVAEASPSSDTATPFSVRARPASDDQNGDEDTSALVAAHIRRLTGDRNERAVLNKLSDRMLAGAESAPTGPMAKDVRTKVLPLPPFLRKPITRFLTQTFLRDVNDFLFHEDRRAAMEQSLIDRLNAGGGPFIVVAHSQGTMIAYNVLRRLVKAQADVRLFVTIGSPLGIAEVQDVLRQWGPLEVPKCVARWVNVADRLDPVAADPDIANDYSGGNIENHAAIGLNPDSPRHPHSGTGYLATSIVRGAVRDLAGNAFAQMTGRQVLVKDLVEDLENGRREARHATLVQLAAPEAGAARGGSLDEIRAELVAAIEGLVRSSGGDPEAAAIEVMRRFVSARLTRLELERLRTRFHDLRIERVWRDAAKRALIHESTRTIQAKPANLGYGASGADVGWAVLDTGIRADHPHFARYANVVTQWDCTKRGAPVELMPGAPRFGTLDGDGHGTHVAGIIAGALEVPLEPGKPAVTLCGMAPQARLYGFKVLGDDGSGQDSWIIKALDKIAEINEGAGRLVIHGVNLSLGGEFDPSVYGCGHTPLCQELRRLWNQGVLVCLAAGNEGYATLKSDAGEIAANMDLSIGDPANLEEAIAVGSIHKTNPHTYGVSYFSSRGPTADGRRKPDLVAPGEQILSAYHRWTANPNPTARDLYIQMSGTSMAAPHVSGLLAAFLSVRREFIGYPNRVKDILFANCTDLKRDPYIQGQGMPNLIKMLTNS
jgi:subtilisin family serine protease